MTLIKRKIRLGVHNYLIIDLTLPLSLSQEGYPEDFKPTRSVFSDIERDGWHHYTHELGDHSFHPHCDAPNHFQAERQEIGMDMYDLSWSFHQAFLIDLAGSEGSKRHQGIRFLTNVTKAHLEPFSELLGKTSAVVVRTGYDKWIEINHQHHPELIPFLTRDAAEYIGSFNNIKVIGIDSLTVDAFGLQVSHQALKDKMIVEALVHLYEIPDGRGDRFDLQTSPIRIAGATGGPVVAYAYIAL